jgi:hypothetical protein
MTRKIDLEVNGNAIKLDRFVGSFVHHTVKGMIESLNNTEPVKELDLSIEAGTVKLGLNGRTIDTNRFVNKIVTSTISGMVSPLKGVSGPLVTARICIQE